MPLQKGYVCSMVGKEAEESYLLKSVPQKLFKAKDVQNPNFKSGIPGWNGRKAQKPHNRKLQESYCERVMSSEVWKGNKSSNHKPRC